MHRRIILATFLAVLVLIGAIRLWENHRLWENRTGTFSYADFQRIQPGMHLKEIEDLLGGPGLEVNQSRVAGIVNWDAPIDSPERVKPVVSGDRIHRWEQGNRYILVSIKGGVVHEKWYWEPSL